jgi:DNA-directed RNA polymerase specialized sigma subunit
MFQEDELHFRLFAKNLEEAIKKYAVIPEETLLERQRRQLKLLILLEKKIRNCLLRHPWGPSVYREFVAKILSKSILAARPYFRERQSVFAAQISKALKKGSATALYKYRINHSFISFALKARDWAGHQTGEKFLLLAKKIEKIRLEILELNLPLAISQSRIFFANTPRSHLSFMDLVQIHCGGLLVAIDKFVPPDSEAGEEEELAAYRKFRAVAIGRMVGDRIEQYSETLVHFFPIDKRKIYRANKARRGMGENLDYAKMAEAVNRDVDPAHKTDPAEIAKLLAASSCVSGDVAVTTESGGEGDTILERYEAEAEARPDLQIENLSATLEMRNQIKALNLFERKFLNLKGIG